LAANGDVAVQITLGGSTEYWNRAPARFP
jgi:hypothetical protein